MSLTRDFVMQHPIVPRVLIRGSYGEKCHRLLILRHFQTVVHPAKGRPIVILIQHGHTHCGLGEIGRSTTISDINCL